MTRMNAKLNLILLIVISLFLAALVSRNGSLIILTIPFLLYLGTGLLFSPGEIQVHASRALSSLRSNENKPVKMLLTIENNGPAIPRLQLSEPVQHNMILVEGLLEQRFMISSGEKVELHYTFQVARGRYLWQTIKLIASDPFGLYENTVNLPAESRALVLPEQFTLQRFKFHPSPTVKTTGPYLSRMAGSGIDFLGVREYHPGDSLRLLNWRKTARHPRCFFSKEFEREEMADIGLLLDARAVTNQYFGTENLFEHSVHAAATLAKFFLSSGNRISMLVLSDNLARIFPGYGKRQLIRILDQLAGCTLGERVTFDTLRYLPDRLFPSRSVIVIISPLLPQDFSTIARLRAKGYQLLLLSPNPAKRFSLQDSKSSFDSFAIRATNLERAVLLRRFQQIGIPVIDWEIDQSLIKTLQSVRSIRM